MPHDPEAFAHLEWLGYVQPVGLVVSIPALLSAQAYINRNIVPDHQRFLSCLPRDQDDQPIPDLRDFAEFTRTVLGWRESDLVELSVDGSQLSEAERFSVVLPEYHETLRPTHVVYEDKPSSSPTTDNRQPTTPPTPLLLVEILPACTSLDDVPTDDHRHWQASPHAKFERLLRKTQVPIGILVTSTHVRIVYAPHGETSGYMTFGIAEMAQVAGRPIFAALHMLLEEPMLFSRAENQRLPAILADSRKYQNHVSNELAQQVLAALYELLRGFQAADEATKGELLRAVLVENPNHVYGGLLTVLMRLVFVLYAEDRGLISSDPVYANFYSVTGLFERLRADAGHYPDTMDQRFGAWAQLLTLFRMIYNGGRHGDLKIPPRKGYLFDPDRYKFLEGRARKLSVVGSQFSEKTKGDESSLTTDNRQLTTLPRVSDGVIFRVLNNLLILDGERLSYRTLDVEQIGSVYETIMGFGVEVAGGRSIAIKPKKSHGAPTSINLETLLAEKPADRNKWLKAHSDQELSGQAATALKDADIIDDLLAALDKKIAKTVTPNVVAKGTMVFQPSDERRRSGSHYTPRSLTEPIVRKTLEPILAQLSVVGSQLSVKKTETIASPTTDNRQLSTPTPDQILALNVCDPAMGSGAFLVEACRQLGDELVTAWHVHQCVPRLPPDEDEVLHARRLIAQRCLYGVDKNPLAVDLAKLSLWLATLAKNHPFTFLDHSLRCGDSLVGLSREQIANFSWESCQLSVVGSQKEKRKKTSASSLTTDNRQPTTFFGDPIAEKMRTVTEYRQRILAARDDKPYEQLRQELDVADEALSLARLTGDCVIAAYFSAGKDRERVAKLDTLARQLVQYLGPQRRIEDRQPLTAAVASLHGGDHPLQPFHWQIEFPEVFTVDANGKPTGGFDAIVGNPPFAGKNTLINGNREGYLDWLKTLHEESHGNADLVAHFFRRAFNLLRPQGCFGLIATNTIGQGDTRSSGLRWICTHGGNIYTARKRLKWPGQAAVVVSVVNVCRDAMPRPFVLDGREVPIITAYLFHAGGHDDPKPLIQNSGRAFIGAYVLGMGFTFDDTDTSGAASPLSEMRALLTANGRNTDVILPYIGGDEVNASPTHLHHRYVINFRDWPRVRQDLGEAWTSASEGRRKEWLSEFVVPLDYPGPVAGDFPDLLRIVEQRVRPSRITQGSIVNPKRWWMFARPASDLYEAIQTLRLDQVLAIARVSQFHQPALLPSNMIYSEQLVVLAVSGFCWFALIQSQPHELWFKFFGSTQEERPRYTPSDCFETFPFPAGVLEHGAGDSPTTDNRPLTALETAGREYYEFRAALMVRHNEGLTKTYNRFHDPHETSPDILQLRALHAAMDRAVLEAYGWHDLVELSVDGCQLSGKSGPRCEFLLDYEDDDDEELTTDNRQLRTRKKPWRYRWPDPFRDEVLARLLELNKQRAEQERLAGELSVDSSQLSVKTRKRKTTKSRQPPNTNRPSLPGF